MQYRVSVEYEVEADDEEQAVWQVRQQLYRDDNLGHSFDEVRLDYIVRGVA